MSLENLRIAFYLRADVGNELSLNFQKRLLERFVARYGKLSSSSIVTYIDSCAPMSSLGPEYLGLLKDVKNGKIDVVIVADIGRICRCASELEVFLTLMEERPFRFISVGDHLDINGAADLKFYRKEVA